MGRDDHLYSAERDWSARPLFQRTRRSNVRRTLLLLLLGASAGAWLFFDPQGGVAGLKTNLYRLVTELPH